MLRRAREATCASLASIYAPSPTTSTACTAPVVHGGRRQRDGEPLNLTRRLVFLRVKTRDGCVVRACSRNARSRGCERLPFPKACRERDAYLEWREHSFFTV